MRSITLLRMTGVDLALLDPLQHALSGGLQARVEVDPTELDASQFFYPPRGQYNSTQILQYLKATFAKPALTGRRGTSPTKAFLAVSANDLFVPVLTFVFGEAELGGRVAVASSFRLQSELYGLPPNRDVLIARLVKEAMHELGHAYGLVHCAEPECVMHASTYVEDIDLKRDTFCEVCQPVLGRT